MIVDGGNFDYAQDPERFPGFNQPDPSYHGLVFARDLGVGGALGANLAYILKARVQLLRDLGPAISPFNAFLLSQGLETLSLRIERHVPERPGGRRVARGARRGRVRAYAGLPSSPWHARAKKYAPKGAGAVLAFEIKGGLEAGKRFVEALELHSHVANIGDVRTLVIHPASTTHSQLTPEEQAYTGVTPGPGPAGRRHRAHRRHPGRPRGRFPGRQGRLTEVPDRSRRPPAPGATGTRSAAGSSPTSARSSSSPAVAARRHASPTRRGAALQPTRDNAVLVLHALTGDTHVVGRPAPGIRRRAGGTA